MRYRKSALKRTRSLSLPVLWLLATGCVTSLAVQAAVFQVKNRPPPMVSLTVGSSGSHISEIRFKIQSGQLGDNNPVEGKPPIQVVVANRAIPDNSRTAVLSADSSAPLTNGAAVILFSEISWSSSDGSIPGGRFDNSSNQFLLSFPNSLQIRDQHRFSYDNKTVPEAGSYTGRVTYTLSMP